MDESGPSKPKWYRQGFCKSWLRDKEFSEWLVQTADGQPSCKMYDCKFKDANKGALQRHMKSEKHIKASAAKKQSVLMDTFLGPKVGLGSASNTLERATTKAELLMAGHMAEHRIPFLQADHMTELYSKLFPDSKIAANMKMKRTKASYVMQDGLAYAEKETISSLCKKNFFSLLIDESTDVSMSQVLAVVVRFIQDFTVKDALLDIVEVESGTAETLYSAVKNLLAAKQIPLERVIGFAADNCATMMGKNSGFQALLKADLANVFILGCICHSFALCASHASQRLPSWLESFLKDVCSYFSRSSKRQRDFDLIQKVVKTESHRMLKLSQTRWLSRGQVIARIIEQWDALLLYFQSEAAVDKVDGASNIYSKMTQAGTKHMLLFLNYILPKVDKMNMHFQSEQPQIHTLFVNISSLYRDLLSLFVKESVLASVDLCDIDPTITSIHRPLPELIVGGRCCAELASTSLGGNEARFRGDCQKFLVELCSQIRLRFEYNNTSVLASLSVLDPEVALSSGRPGRPAPIQTLASLASYFPQVVKNEELDSLDDEWRGLPQAQKQLEHLKGKSVPEFWTLLLSVKDGTGQLKFPTLGRFMCVLAVLPHSSACVERVFSEVNIVKTPVTNRLHATTVANRLLARQHLKRNNKTCCTWSPDEELLNSMIDGSCYRRYHERIGNCNDEEMKYTFMTYDPVEIGEDVQDQQ